MAWNTKKGDIVRNAKMPNASPDGTSFETEGYWSGGSGVGGVASKTGGYTSKDPYLSGNKGFKKNYVQAGPNRSVTKA